MSFNPPNPPNLPPHGQTAPAASKKVAIPRLQRSSLQPQPSKDRRRVPRACTACRAHKIKCTGDSPQCKHCETTGRECIYIMPRKDRLKIVTDRCVQMAGLLKTLRDSASEEDSARIGELLGEVDEDISDIRHPPTSSNPDTNEDDSRASTAITDGTVVGEWVETVTNESLQIFNENVRLENDSSRATGFVGQHSEIHWLRSFLLLERVDDDTIMAMTPKRRGFSAGSTNNGQVNAVTFYTDEKDMSLDYRVNQYDHPPIDVAETLLHIYMEKVHHCFPILQRRLFEEQFRINVKGLSRGVSMRLNNKWQGTLNLVFAIGSKCSHLAKMSPDADAPDHLIYQARARMFAWNGDTLTEHPDLPQIQVAGLLSFYYLSIGQANRAWVVVGIAIRFATALGLHVRNEDPSAPGPKREGLVRTWWSLCYLERQISVMTGRPSMIVDTCCSVPLPLPFSEQQISGDVSMTDSLRKASVPSLSSPVATHHLFSGPQPMIGIESRSPLGFGMPEANSGSYFKAVVEMCLITQSIVSSLYLAGTTIRSSDELQQDIVQFGQRLDAWVANLPADLNFQVQRSRMTTSEDLFFRERTLLAFQLCGAKILLTRRYLGGLRSGGATKEGTAATGFSWQMASICIDTAKMAVNLLPDQPSPRFVYEFCPWWTIVHNLMQAHAVLVLALSHSTMQQEIDELASYCTKIISWLRSMDDALAVRAYHLALGCFEVVANRLSLNTADLWLEHEAMFPTSEHDAAMEAVHPGLVPMGAGMGFAPAMAPFASAGMTDGNSSAFQHYDSLASGSMFVPTADGQLYDDSMYHQPGGV